MTPIKKLSHPLFLHSAIITSDVIIGHNHTISNGFLRDEATQKISFVGGLICGLYIKNWEPILNIVFFCV